mmetsp:Transcript_5010/g.8543  ORF Transcript_5010/g.8543 Transcript_5010/m.8543 type:complete len:116 (+) Transcript_5010:921-1268(+)
MVARALDAMMLFGIGEVLSGILSGLQIDRFGSRRQVLFNLSLILLTVGVSVLSIRRATYDWVTYVMCFLWGYQDGAINIHTFQILGNQFESQSEPFGVFNSVQGIAVFLACIIQG